LPRLWIEGINPSKVELWVDGRLAEECASSPFSLLTADAPCGQALTRGRHTMLVRAWQKGQLLEREFAFDYRK
jgi:hypothetical protein